jgi:L-alanine-DL-glutamate epimerase-like enolase superfamily enzyme
MIDANCIFDTRSALRLITLLDGANVKWFEEPLRGNDWQDLRWLRDRSAIPLSAGQFLPDSWAHRELIANGSIDIAQPNVCTCGGYTESIKVAALARAFNLPIANGGGWPHHNLHLQAGAANGSYVEYHWLMWSAGNAIFRDPPSTKDGWADIPGAPGLGFEPKSAEERRPYLL